MGDFEPRVPASAVVHKVTRGKHSYASTGPNPLVRSASAPSRSFPGAALSGPVHGVETASRMRTAGKDWRHNSAKTPQAWRAEGTSHAMAGPRPFILRKTSVESMVDNPRWDGSRAPMTMGGGGKPKRVQSAIPPYDPLSDPAMADYWARKFGWTVAGASGPSRRRTGSARGFRDPTAVAEYKVEVLTSSRHPAPAGGTKCIELMGSGGTTGEMPLKRLGQTRRRQFAAGALDTFMLEGHDVGTPSQIRLVNKSDAKIHGWFCSSVTVTAMATGKKVTFVVDGWLSKYEGDCVLELVRSASKGSKGSSRYQVNVKTGAAQRQRCTASVYITLFGSKNKTSGQVRLVSNTPCFEGGRTDVFTITTPRIGKLSRMIVEHDGAGDSPEWLLEEVTVTHIGTGATYNFRAGMWFSESRGDGRTSRELHAHAEPAAGGPGAAVPGGKCELLVEVFTGDVKYGGTNANVSLQIFGDSGSFGPIHLRKEGSHSPFVRGAHASFPIEADDVGAIRRIRIGHDNSGQGPSWFLKQVRIKHLGTGECFTFPCERWFDRERDDGHISRELVSQADAGDLGAYALTPYHIFISTSSKRDAGTDANVSAELIGTEGRTGKFPLENGKQNFTRGRTDEFVIPTANVGELTGIVLEHDNTGSGPEWLVEKVAVASPKLGKMYQAQANVWLTTDDTLNPKAELSTEISFDPKDVKAFVPKGTWVCSTHTADKSGASTSAKVFIQVYGENGKSDEIPLYNHAHTFDEHFKRGAVDKFQVQLESLGELRKLRVWHDNSGGLMGATWALDKIVLQHVDSGAEYVFPCGLWLSRRDGDGEIVRELAATGPTIAAPLPLKKYVVRTFTGKKNGAGTDANVHAVLYGSLGDSGPRLLRKSATHWDKFEAGNEDVFTFEACDLGTLERVKIGHDNRGMGPSWFLDRVTAEVEGEDARPIEFPCKRWLAKSEDDGQIERTLFSSASNSSSITYQITVYTGDVRNAGTDANVYITMFGDKGDSGKIALRSSLSHGDKFERGRIDVFKVEAADFGALQKIQIGHDNSGMGPNWFLDRVEVDVPSTARKYTFNCGRWLSRVDDDKQIERELLLDKEAATADPSTIATYECNVYTADVRNAGTDAKVFVTMFGKDGKKTDEMRITNNTDNFERGQRDTFRLDFEDIGPPLKLAVRHDNSGFGPNWCLSRIEMHNLKDNVIYTFAPPPGASGGDDDEPAGLWLSKDKGLSADLVVSKVERLTEAGAREEVEKEDFQREAEHTKYTVLVHTADEADAGTDANVFIVVTGTLGSSGERPLSKATQVRGEHYHRDKFERGKTDEFAFDCVNLGELLKVQIRHDNRGLGPSWLLASVDVSDGSKTFSFPCNKWLSKSKGDKQLQRELPVLQAATAATGALHGNVTKYHVRVYTSDLRNAGTDANMHIVIFGENGDTGKVHLKTSAEHKDKFERGNVDSFVVDAVGLGEIKKIRIGHDSSGLGPDWHCERIEIAVPQEGKEYKFECGRWFSKKREDGATERVLVPTDSSDTVPRVPFEVQIYTSDVDGAGTTCKVAMTVYGKDVLTGETVQREIDFGGAPAGKGFLSRGRGTKEGVLPDSLQNELEDFGEPFKLVVTLDPGDKRSTFSWSKASWHLDRVVLVNKLTHTRYSFPCGKWLSGDKGKDGGVMTRSLQIGEISTFDEDTKSQKSRTGSFCFERRVYLVKVTTGDIYQAGTDAKVFVTLFGDNGDSGERQLNKVFQTDNDDGETHSDLFERGHTDVFKVEDLDLGELSKITIRHDNSSWKKSWFLDNVVVQIQGSSKQWRFPCSQWFSKKKGDKQISRDITALVDPARLNKLEENARAAVKRARAELAAVSTEGKSGAKADAERAANKKRELLALEHRLADLIRQQETQVAGVKDRGELVTYEVTVTTGDKPKADTSAKVSVEFLGHTVPDHLAVPGSGAAAISSSHVVPTSTGRIELVGKPGAFKRGATTVFSVKGVDIGELVEMRIGHDDKNPAAAWFLDNVSVRISRPNAGVDPFTYNFPCSSWLSTNSTWRTLIAESASETATRGDVLSPDSQSSSGGHTYRVEVLTGDIDKSGTDARVSLVLTGVLGESPELKLRESTTFSDKFERGHTDVFVFNDVEDLGKLTQARVWHDNGGFGPSWFLEHITVFDQTTESKFEFPCGKWLSRAHEDGLTERVLPCAEYVMNGFVVAYDIELCTARGSRSCSAGPIVKLIGDDRSSDEIELPLPPGGMLPPGEPVVYTRDLPALGNILEAHVRLPAPTVVDGAGGAWDLAYVKVTERRLGTVWEFPCGKPVPYGGSHVALRQSAVQAHAADSAQAGELVNYEIATVTSDIRGAGTDANVFVTLWGRLDGAVTTSGKRPLAKSKTHRDKFERGNEDVFYFEAVDLGKLEKLRIEHDARGWKNSDWHLDCVKVRDPRTEEEIIFPCGQWISKRRETKELWRELFPKIADS